MQADQCQTPSWIIPWNNYQILLDIIAKTLLVIWVGFHAVSAKTKMHTKYPKCNYDKIKIILWLASFGYRIKAKILLDAKRSSSFVVAEPWVMRNWINALVQQFRMAKIYFAKNNLQKFPVLTNTC